MSLPRILGTTLETIPAGVPYLFADNALRERWREKMGPARGLKVGIQGQGNVQYAGDRHRSVRLEQFRPLAEVAGVQLFSIQKGKGSEQLEALAQEWHLTDLGGQISADFRDTAAALANLDLVVSVDTSVAHLAGSLGIPLWVLLPFNPDWRWLLEREDSLWYPNARLFRQQRWGDWDEVFARVAEALQVKARRPLLPWVQVQVSLSELLERAVLEEIRHGRAERTWSALREAGVPDSVEMAGIVAGLKAAHEELECSGRQMQALEPAADLGTQAVALVQRYAQAKTDQGRCLGQFAAWLAGETPEGVAVTRGPSGGYGSPT